MTTHFRRYMITGLLVILPFFLTGYILWVVFRFADGILGRFINEHLFRVIGFYIPGLGLILSIVILYIAGYLTAHVIGKKMHAILEKWFTRFPLTRYIYPSIKQILQFFFSAQDLNFKKVVLIEYPRKGVWALAFMTNEGFQEANSKTGEDLLSIYVPTTPSPLTGYLRLVPRREVIFLEMSVEEALKLIVSGGLLNPPGAGKSA
jgi:uncharacterized membrane protein